MVRRAGLAADVVIGAAIDVMQAEGADALTLARVAEKLGVRTPSLYKHVDGLDGLRRGIALWGVQALTRRLGRAAVGKSGDEALLAMADAYRQFAKAYPGVYTMTQRAPAPDDQDLAGATDELLDLMRAVLQPYGLGDEGMVHAIRGFRALVHGFASLEILGGFGMPLDVELSFRHLVTLFIRGLGRA